MTVPLSAEEIAELRDRIVIRDLDRFDQLCAALLSAQGERDAAIAARDTTRAMLRLSERVRASERDERDPLKAALHDCLSAMTRPVEDGGESWQDAIERARAALSPPPRAESGEGTGT